MPSPPKVLTQKAYLAKGGGRCPVCSSSDIEAGGVDIDGPAATQEVQCSECDASWTDVYRLVGYRDLTQ